MRGFTFLRVRGIPIEIHASWLVLFLIIFQGVMGRFRGPEVALPTLVAMATACSLLFFISILLHELEHAFWALRARWQVERITLYGLGGLAWVRPGGPYFSLRTDFQVTAAGPVVTAVLILVFGATERAGEALGWPEPVVDVAGYLTLMNVGLLVFNLAPAFPLDGGQMLRAWLARRSGDSEAAGRTVLRTGAVTGYALVGGAIVLLVTGMLSAGFTAAFAGLLILFLVARYSTIASPTAQRSSIEVVGDLLQKSPVVVPAEGSVTDFLDRTARARGHSTRAFGVTRDGEVVGYMSLGLAHQIPAEERESSTVLGAMVRREEAIQLDPNTPLEQALEQLQDANDHGVVVEDGRVTAIVLRQAVAEALLEAADARRGRSELAGLQW
ncbi:MAG: CBS domain-containing protein [Thermoleophilaceae bacterium]|nr:CBS domain-containing protein [Thermoleophilaceae bacterium]